MTRDNKQCLVKIYITLTRTEREGLNRKEREKGLNRKERERRSQ